MNGLALAFSDLPLELVERHGLARFVHERGGEKEVRFLRQMPNVILPVRHEGLLRIVSWGTVCNQVKPLRGSRFDRLDVRQVEVLLRPRDDAG